MTPSLFDLLPAIHRLRDAAQGSPLRELLEIVGEQVAVLEEDLAQLYDDQFIETCADWVVPYIGDLVGYRSLHSGPSGLATPRAEVAHTIGYRRRKGTPGMLEQLARDVTGWPARVVEFFQFLVGSQYMNHVRSGACLTPDLRRWADLEALDGPFEALAHTADMRSIAADDPGRHNLPNVGIFLWRLGAHRLSESPAAPVDARRFHFNPLGCRCPLFTQPQGVADAFARANRLNVPAPISSRRLDESLADYYGPDLSVCVAGVPLESVRVCDLSDDAGTWAHTPPAGLVAIDPMLGRLAFGDAPETPPRVTFHAGFSTDLGGGEYERTATFALPAQPAQAVAAPATLAGALAARTPGVPIEIEDNGRYEETLSLAVAPGEHFELRAADGRRPLLLLGGELEISGGDAETEVSLNGLVIAGGRLRVSGALGRLRLSHCTLVPGWTLDDSLLPQHPDEPGLVVEQGGVAVTLDDCIVGGVRWHELSRLELRGTFVDATARTGVALAGPGPVAPGEMPPPGGTLRAEESTVFGQVRATILELASNAIFDAGVADGDGWPAPVVVERRQTGCARFSYLPDGARTPRRYRCQPELAVATALDAADRLARSQSKVLGVAEKAAIRTDILASLQPSFTSARYGDAGYGQLRARAPQEIREGADDGAAMGALHDVFEPQRLANLRLRLQEYLRFGLEAGAIAVT